MTHVYDSEMADNIDVSFIKRMIHVWEANQRMNPDLCDGKTVQIEGRTYQLKLVE